MALTKSTEYEVLFKITDDIVVTKKLIKFYEDSIYQTERVEKNVYANNTEDITRLDNDLASYPSILAKIKAFAGWT